MKSFFTYFSAALLAIFTAIVILFLSIVVTMFFSKDDGIKIADSAVLHLDFENNISERQTPSTFSFNMGEPELIKHDGLDLIVNQIHRASTDDKIKGIYLDFRSIDARFASVQVIREALTEFKKSGKWIVAYSDVMTQKAYYLASVADELYMQPKGMMEFKGLFTKIAFLKNTLDKVGVKMQVIRPKNNRFKSAVEPFMLDSMSASNELQTEKLLSGIWSNITETIGKDRDLTSDELNVLADALVGFDIPESAKSKLIDAAKYRDEVEDIILAKLESSELDEQNVISLATYSRGHKSYNPLSTEDSNNNIAIIYAVGEIGIGEGDESSYQMGSDALAEAIKEVRLDDDIKAVVLRVNSPGGGVLASDVIWREMKKTQDVKKVVVSMGDLAASGGYYISTPSDKIFAQKNTITGSIGVFGVIPNTEELYKDILDMNFDQVKTNKHSDIFDITRPLKKEEEEGIQMMIDRTYQNFLSIVSESRGLSIAQVDSIAQGRVWAGEDAVEIGLVDAIGGLQDAIKEAANLSGINDYTVVSYPKKELNPMMEMMSEMMDASTNRNFIEEKLKENPQLFQTYLLLNRANQMKGLQMRMEYELIIE